MNKNIYLIITENRSFIKETINKLTKDKDVIRYDMEVNNINEVIEDLSTMSLFSEKKVIICNNIDKIIEEEIFKNLLNKQLTNELILITNTIDKRKKITKDLLKTVNVLTYEKDCNEFVEEQLKGYKISNNDKNFLIEYIGDNLDILKTEIDKLKIYKEDKVITKEDILEISSKKQEDIFKLVDAIIKKNYDNALLLYDEFLSNKEEIIKLLIILANQFRLIYQTKNMYKQGYTEKDIIELLQVHPYRIKLAKNISITEEESLYYLNKIIDLDYKIKIGKIDKNLVFENLLFDI